MKSKLISPTRLVVIILLSFCLGFAAWLPFGNSRLAQDTETQVLSSSSTFLSFRVSLAGCYEDMISTKGMINTNNETFSLLTIPDGYYTGEIGKPQLPTIKKTIGVPFNATLSIEILDADYEEVSLQEIGINNRIMPVLASVLKMPGEKPIFELDELTYAHDGLYPQEIVRTENDDIMRGHRLALLEIVPIQYNPVTNSIRFYTNIEIRISFTSGDFAKTKQRVRQDYSILFEDFIEDKVLNYSFYEQMLRDVLPLPIHYLIITHNSFQTQVGNLAYWLKKKGFDVKVANQDSISPWNVSGIENYIDAQSPAPTYLLLVGDVNGGYMPAPTGGSSNRVTDLYYAELDGTGYLPDIFHGRLSCETSTHITTEVEKILKYQKANMPTGWYKDDVFLAGNDNYTVSEGTHNYCTSTFMDPHGYTTYKLYEQTYGATTQDVFDNVNAGRILVTMSGHGSDDGWYDGPPFQVTHVNQLTNGDRLTIATGHCCLANNFGSSTNPCGGESWIRKQNGGAVAYYGSCPSTYWDEDDWLQREWYEAIYADEIYEHGRFTEDGMYDGVYQSSSGMKQYYYEAYHVLGDPSLDLWTEEPQNMNVNYPAIVFPGVSTFTVTVTDGGPLANALVCCWIPNQSPEMHVAEYTNASGNANLSIAPTTPGDTMYVTVTRHNYVPHQGYALVTTASGPYVSLGSLIINDSGGDGVVNPGETVDLGVWAKNIGSEIAFSVYGLLSESDPYVSLSIDSSWYGNIAVDDSSLSNPYYHFTVAANCPNNHGISFGLEFHDTNDTIWTATPSVTVYAPVLTYQGVSIIGGNGNGILDPGETTDVVITIENEGGATAANVTSTLWTSSPYITINDASGNFGTIDPGNQGNNSADPYNVTASATTPTGTICDFEVEVVSGVYVDTLQFSIVVGKKHYYIWNPDPTPAPGAACHTILGNLGYSGDYGTTLASDLTLYQAVLVFVGIYANNYVIGAGSAEAAALVDFLENQGGRMYLEGGDVWYYDPLYQSGYDFGPLFGINATADGTSDGGPFAGQASTFTTGMNFAYGGENSYIDHISPTGTGFLIFYDTDNAYDAGVANDAGSYRTCGLSFELGGLTDASPPSTRAALLDSIMKFFGIVLNPGIQEGGLVGLPMKTLLSALYPNPGMRVMSIRYQVAHSADVSLCVYDAAGRLVRRVVDGACEPGYYTQVWDSRDDLGRKVPAGVYFVRFETDDYQKTEKAILLK